MVDIFYQMYCLWDYDIVQIMLMLVGMGYKVIEGYGFFYFDVDVICSFMVENGLIMLIGYFSIDIVEDMSGVLEIVNVFGVDNIIVFFIVFD